MAAFTTSGTLPFARAGRRIVSSSLPTFAAFTVGVAMWLAYGVVRNELPIILWNAVTLVLAGAIVVMKIRFG